MSDKRLQKKAHEIVEHCLEAEVFCDLYYDLLTREGWSQGDMDDCFSIVHDIRLKHGKKAERIKLEEEGIAP